MDSLFRSGLFEGMSALVTGGGTGIGRAAAQSLAALGARVAICGRRLDPLERVATELEQSGADVFHASCDIRVPEAVDQFVADVHARFGAIDILVNNAGGQFPTQAASLSPRGFEAVVRNNLLGTWHVTRAVATAAMIPARRGRIINVIAQVSRGFPGMVHTGAARAGVENMTRTLAIEWTCHGIRVNAVAPGVIATEGVEQYPPELVERARLATPLKRLGTAHEVAQLIAYLASPHADYITGQTFHIDGGQSLWGDTWHIPDDVPQFAPPPTGSSSER